MENDQRIGMIELELKEINQTMTQFSSRQERVETSLTAISASIAELKTQSTTNNSTNQMKEWIIRGTIAIAALIGGGSVGGGMANSSSIDARELIQAVQSLQPQQEKPAMSFPTNPNLNGH